MDFERIDLLLRVVSVAIGYPNLRPIVLEASKELEAIASEAAEANAPVIEPEVTEAPAKKTDDKTVKRI